jgi:hypothetical protein
MFRNIAAYLEGQSLSNAKVILAEKPIIMQIDGTKFGATCDLLYERDGLYLYMFLLLIRFFFIEL